MTQEVLRTPFTRLFITEDGASPANVPVYQGLGRAGGIDWGQGTLEPVRIPSSSQYDKFDIIDMIQGPDDLPTITIESRMQSLYSEMMRIVSKRCVMDVHIHAGQCQNPEDFDGGWDSGIILETARPSNYSTDDLGALDPSQNALITETVPVSAERIYGLKKLRPSEVAAAVLTDIVNRVIVCDSKTCGECGVSSDGCQVVFAVTGPTTGSPGVPSELLYTTDGGATWTGTTITTLGLAEEAIDGVCVGVNFAVISVSGTTGRISYAPIADILTGTETWTLVTTGFVAGAEPIKMFSLDSTHTWIAAEGGYIYFTDDITSGVEVQTDGSVTAQNLNAVHAVDRDTIVAVGDSNAVLSSDNGGASWSLVTGPVVGVDLLALYMQSAERWLIGTNGGELWYTTNGGVSFTEKAFNGSGSGAVRDIDFATKNVGYLVHDNAAAPVRSFVLRTINGGNSWKRLPEDTGIVAPSSLSQRSVAACRDNPNVVFAGGTGTGGTDGFLVKYA